MAPSFETVLREVKAGVEAEIVRFFEEKRKAFSEKGLEIDLLDALAEFTLRGGKRLRPALAWVGFSAVADPGDDRKLYAALVSLEILQSYLLVHDDIMDRSDVRRGKPALHVSLGEAMAILAGDLGSALFLEPIVSSGFPLEARMNAIHALLRTHGEVILGQALDLRGQAPAERIMLLKTASYTTVGPARIGAALAGAAAPLLDALEAWAIPAGLAFQLRDDILGLFGSEAETGKPAGRDLSEGKQTFLVEQARAKGTTSETKALEAVFGKPSASAADIRAAIDAVRSSGALDDAEAAIARWVEASDRALDGASIRNEARGMLSEASRLLAFRRF